MENLYLIYLGGKSNNSNIEYHDVMFCVGESIDETYPLIVKEAIGCIDSIHIDSYTIVKYIEGYKVIPTVFSQEKGQDSIKDKLYLWFVYLGGYEHNNILESHQIVLVVSGSENEAKRRAKAKANHKFKMVHIDNIRKLSAIKYIDKQNVHESKIWSINLEKDPLERSQGIMADWQGYKKLY